MEITYRLGLYVVYAMGDVRPYWDRALGLGPCPLSLFHEHRDRHGLRAVVVRLCLVVVQNTPEGGVVVGEVGREHTQDPGTGLGTLVHNPHCNHSRRNRSHCCSHRTAVAARRNGVVVVAALGDPLVERVEAPRVRVRDTGAGRRILRRMPWRKLGGS